MFCIIIKQYIDCNKYFEYLKKMILKIRKGVILLSITPFYQLAIF